MQFNAIVKEITEIAKLIHLDVHGLLQFPLRKSAKFMSIVWMITHGRLRCLCQGNFFDVVVRNKQLKDLIKRKLVKRSTICKLTIEWSFS